MTDKEIVIKAINKVGNKGLNLNEHMSVDTFLNGIIFSHDFCKSFWGDDELDNRGRTLIKAWEEEWRDSGHFMDFEEYTSEPEIYYQIAWIYHLGKMVLEKEPIKYLEKFLK